MAVMRGSDLARFPFRDAFNSHSSLGIAPLRESNARWTAWRRSDYFYPEIIPDPDYSLSEEEEEEGEERLREVEEENEDEADVRKRLHDSSTQGLESSSSERPKSVLPRKSQSLDHQSLIKPKKPAHPYVHSEELQKLHRELKFNQKYGRSSMHQKTELQEALRKFTEDKTRKSLAQTKQTSLEKILAKQAEKIKRVERKGNDLDPPSWIEQLQEQHISNRKQTDPKTAEFYRVHARVVRRSTHSTPTEQSSKNVLTTSQSDSII